LSFEKEPVHAAFTLAVQHFQAREEGPVAGWMAPRASRDAPPHAPNTLGRGEAPRWP
jgi:hypothetical protein